MHFYATLMAATSLPRILVSPVAGVWVDRSDRRWMLVAADIGCGTGTVARWMAEQVGAQGDVAGARSLCEEALAEMRADKTSATGDQEVHAPMMRTHRKTSRRKVQFNPVRAHQRRTVKVTSYGPSALPPDGLGVRAVDRRSGLEITPDTMPEKRR